MRDSDRKAGRFAVKLVIALLPLLALGTLFVVFDPFRVLFTYDDYSRGNCVVLNREYVSVEVFKKNRLARGYDSFIFGSSRTLGFDTHDWMLYLPSGASPFHFDASAENVYGIRTKILYLRKLRTPIRNALVIVCPDVTFKSTTARSKHLQVPHFELSGQSALAYYGVFFKAFINPAFLVRFLDHKISGRVKPWMHGYISPSNPSSPTNDLWTVDQEKAVAVAGEDYWTTRPTTFYERPTHPEAYPPQIGTDAEAQLRVIAAVLSEENTEYRIVVSPLYDQRAMAPSDVALLRRIFGAARVFDYSGVNRITADKHNYYEESHFRPQAGREILKDIYGEPRSSAVGGAGSTSADTAAGVVGPAGTSQACRVSAGEGFL